MRTINVALAILVSLLLSFAVFEGGLRLFPQFRPQTNLNQFDSKLGWAKKPNLHADRSTSEFDIEFEINSLGLRDDAMSSTDKPDGTHRVLMLGDSFVLGYTVDRDHLFVDHLENWWTNEGRNVDVVNAGTEGYSTDQQVLWFLEHGVDFDPDLVLVFPYENDIYWNGQDAYQTYPKPRFQPDGTLETGTLADPGQRSGLKNLAVGKLLGMVAGALGGGGGGANHAFTPAGGEAPVYSEFAPLMNEPPSFVADCLARTKGALTALRDRCAELDARLVMIPIPSESVVHEDERERFQATALPGVSADQWDPNRPVDAFLAMASELGIESLDPRAKLKQSGAQKPLYFEKEWHFNPDGNEVFAGYLHGELDRLGVFPSEHSATQSAELVVASTEDGGGVPTWLMVYGALVLILGTCFAMTYRDEPTPLAYLKVAGLLAFIFAIIIGGGRLLGALSPGTAQLIGVLFVVAILGFVAYKLGRRLATILELLRSFTLRGHWYLMPLVVVLLTIGSLLVVAASSPLVAPFIYTLF